MGLLFVSLEGLCGEGLLLLCFQDVVAQLRVQFLAQVQQVLLQLGKGADHDGVFEIAGDGLLELLHVRRRELSHAVGEQTASLTVAGCFLILKFINKT